MHFAPTRPTLHKGAFATFVAAALVATLLAIAAPSAQAQQGLPPIADAGSDKVYPISPAERTLDGTRSLDVEGLSLTYRWQVVTPAYNWLTVVLGGTPYGSEATFISPSQAEVNRYGSTITFRLTVTNSGGASDSDTVIVRFEGLPTAAIAVTAHLPDPDATDLDGDGVIEDDELYTIDAILARPGQGGNEDNEWDIKEGTRLTLRGTGSVASGNTAPGSLKYYWQKLSAVPNRAQFNIPTSQRNKQSFSVKLLDNLEAGRQATVQYDLTVTSSTGLQTHARVRINVVDQPATPKVEIELADSRQPVQDANALNPDAPTQRYVVSPGASVALIATATDADPGHERTLAHTWSGTGVTPSTSNRTGPTSRATFTVPANAVQGQSFTVTVSATDSTNRTGRDQVVFIAVDNDAPEAIAPANFPTEDGPRGGTDNQGTVFVTGQGTDADGDLLSYRWVQVDEDGVPKKKPTVELANADTATVSFASPQLSASGLREIHLALTVVDHWGVGDADTVTVTVLGRNDFPVAHAGPDQIVEPGAQVRLDGSDSFDTDPGTRLVWSWKYTKLVTTPSASQRPLTAFDKKVLLGFEPDGNDYSHLDPLVGENTPTPYFTAPQLGGLTSVQLTFTLTVEDGGGGRGTDTVTVTITGQFFSGNIDGPDFCTNLSLGGPRTYAFDSDGDDVADVCALPYTRREAVARQNALITLASLAPDALRIQVVAACGRLGDDFNDAASDLAADACATRRVSDQPLPVDPVLAGVFYSGAVNGPDFCANLSLGGPRTYAFDSDLDGVADVCALPYTRREAVARQNALETFVEPQAVFDSAVALACRDLGTTAFEGDSAADLARDVCA